LGELSSRYGGGCGGNSKYDGTIGHKDASTRSKFRWENSFCEKRDERRGGEGERERGRETDTPSDKDGAWKDELKGS